MNSHRRDFPDEVVNGWSNQELLEFIKLGLFDSDFYLTNNPDLVTAGVDPLLHFLEFGWREGRRPSAEVNQTEMDFLRNLVDSLRNPLQIMKMNHRNSYFPNQTHD
jgi:hypothetical protein